MVREFHAGDSAVTKPKIRFSVNKILGEREFDNYSDENVDLPFSRNPSYHVLSV